MRTFSFIVLAMVFQIYGARAADSVLDKLRNQAATLAPAAPGVGLGQEEIARGLKEALSKGVERAVAALGKEDGFLKDAAVKISMPANLQKVEAGLRKIGQGALADDFVTTLNRAAEQAVPEAAAVLAESVKQMSIADAASVLTGTNNAATQYFRRTADTNLYQRFLPIVKQATAKAGATSAYKAMLAKASGGFGGFGAALFKSQSLDVDALVTRKALDGLFLKIAEQEKLIRENPSARATDILKKVFGGA